MTEDWWNALTQSKEALGLTIVNLLHSVLFPLPSVSGQNYRQTV